MELMSVQWHPREISGDDRPAGIIVRFACHVYASSRAAFSLLSLFPVALPFVIDTRAKAD